MWPLTDGDRCLAGSEASLFRGAVGMLVDSLVVDLYDSDELNRTGEFNDIGEPQSPFGFEIPRWYSMWEPCQRLWLLERVTTALLTARSAPPASAMFEATIEAVYIEVADCVAMEITEGKPIDEHSWRRSLLDAYATRCPQDSLLESMQFEATTMDSCLPPALKKQISAAPYPSSQADDASENSAREQDWLTWWSMVIERLVDATYGVRVYHQAERFRDGDPEELSHYLQSKGVNAKFTQRMPPFRSPSQTQATIDRLQAIVFQN